MKICFACSNEKPLTEFSNRKDRKDGLHFWCKPCLKLKKAESYQRNREKALAAMTAYRKANPEKVAAAKKRCYEAKPEHYRARGLENYAANRETRISQAQEWRDKNKERYEANHKAYRENNRKLLSLKACAYQKANRRKASDYNLRYVTERYKNDPLFALQKVCRRRLLWAFTKGGYRKGSKTEDILGCDFRHLLAHLESQFTPGMTWENRGKYGWHIDHRVPLSSAQNKAELERLCHYQNLQPLWAADNLAKGAKMPDEWEGLRHGRQDD